MRPIGYIGSFAALAAKRGLDFDAYWKAGATTELHHFIGKDISYFHTLFWPAVLHGAGFRRPTGVHVHGFLTVNGQKMSKSRGTFITAQRYLELLPPDPLRYYFAAKLGNGLDDIDLNLEDFTARVNSDIVGKLVNIASRCARLHRARRRPAGRRAAGPGAVRASSPPLREPHRRAVRAARLRRRDARDHAARRPRQPVRRPAQALGAGQGSGAGSPRRAPCARRASTCSAC